MNLEKEFKELLIQVKSLNGEDADLKLIKEAWNFAKLAHTGQSRKSGEPYVIHPLETAKILASWKLDTPSIVAGLLHDTVEDGAAEKKDIVKVFGEEIAELVDGVTKVSYLKLRGSKEEEFVENLRKMFLAMAKDLRVVLIKIADRLHNTRTLGALPSEKQVKNAKETLEIFAPLADRLGMGSVKGELEDLAFKFVYPDDYATVVKLSQSHYKKAEERIKKMKHTLLKVLAQEDVKSKIEGRKKRFYSLWRKLERQEINWDFEKIHDIVALRILVDTVSQCYTVLGLVHAHYKPVPYLGVSDFIAQPKPNGYKSIHTKIFGPDGKIVELQIRTFDMHEQAEYGVASHWQLATLKSGGKLTSIDIDKGIWKTPENKLSWVKELALWQKEISDSKEFLQAVKFDALRERIFVFTPKGDVFDLPLGSTPIDFAYAVHTDLGEYLKAVKVDGKMVPLEYKLKSGQVVEIVKDKNPKSPSRDWLEFVVTIQAKREIMKKLKKQGKI